RNTNPRGNEQTIGGFVGLLPFIEQGNLYNQIASPWDAIGNNPPSLPFGPPRDFGYYPPWAARLTSFICPSAPEGLGYNNNSAAQLENKRHYAMCLADTILNSHGGGTTTVNSLTPRFRGSFGFGRFVKIGEMSDGTSNTIILGERANAVDARNVKGL